MNDGPRVVNALIGLSTLAKNVAHVYIQTTLVRGYATKVAIDASACPAGITIVTMVADGAPMTISFGTVARRWLSGLSFARSRSSTV